MIYLAFPQYSHHFSLSGLPCLHWLHVHESDEIKSSDCVIGTLKNPFKRKAMAAQIQKFIVVSFVIKPFFKFPKKLCKE